MLNFDNFRQKFLKGNFPKQGNKKGFGKEMDRLSVVKLRRDKGEMRELSGQS